MTPTDKADEVVAFWLEMAHKLSGSGMSRERFAEIHRSVEIGKFGAGTPTKNALLQQAEAQCATLKARLGALRPGMVRNEEGGFVEFVNEDVATITGQMEGRNVEPFYRMNEPRELVGYRVYDALLSTREGGDKP